MNKSIFFLKLFIILFFTSCFFTAKASSNLYIIQPASNQVFTLTTAQTTKPVFFAFNGSTDAIDWKIVLKTHLGQPDQVMTSFGDEGYNSWYDLGPGSYHFEVELFVNQPGSGYVSVVKREVYFTVKFNVRAKNNFNSGTINMDGTTKNNDTAIPKYPGETFAVGAIDQAAGGYNMVWNTNGTNNSIWKKQLNGQNPLPISGVTSRNYNYSVQNDDNGTTLIADMKKICNVIFQSSKGKPVIVNGTSYNTPTAAFPVVESNPITASVANFTENNINFIFQHFTNTSGQIVTSPFNPTSHNTYTAQYKGYPLNTNRNLTSPSPAGQAVTITWNEHPSPDVTKYQIWRRIALHSSGSQYGPEELIATVNRGTCTYTDQTQCKATLSYDLLLQYDVRAYYAPDQTTSSTSYITVWGVFWDPLKAANNSAPIIPLKTELKGNFPNPFNPTTQIRFSLKDECAVSLKIYNILGGEVETLINNEIIAAGEHSYNFNGSNLPSGLYIITFNTRDYSESRKMMLLK